MIDFLLSTGIRVGDDDDKIRLNQRKPSKYKGLRRFGPEKNLQRINKFMKERPIFYKNLIQMKENIRFYLRCFYCITKVMILQFNSENIVITHETNRDFKARFVCFQNVAYTYILYI